MDVAQLVELQIVVLAVAGSSPVIHPIPPFPWFFSQCSAAASITLQVTDYVEIPRSPSFPLPISYGTSP